MRIDVETFTKHKYAAKLLGQIREALKALSKSSNGDNYSVPPKLAKLARPSPEGARLLPGYKQIWDKCFIVFDPGEKGASINLVTCKISFGPFFVSRWKRIDVEKVILHEYLHKAIALQPSYGSRQFRDEAQHGEIDHIIKYELGYPGDPRGMRAAH